MTIAVTPSGPYASPISAITRSVSAWIAASIVSVRSEPAAAASMVSRSSSSPRASRVI